MIDAILTGMTGRTPALNRVYSSSVSKEDKPEQKQQASQPLDNISLSSEALELYNSDKVAKSAESENNGEQNDNELTEEEQEEIKELEKRDQEVRKHEQAHQAAGAPYTSAPAYEYTTGPDNKQYATGGEVKIDTSKESTPEKTIEKAKVIKRSAQAPAEPSAQDRRVAAEASRMEMEAQAELRKEKSESSGNHIGFAAYASTKNQSVGSNINQSF